MQDRESLFISQNYKLSLKIILNQQRQNLFIIE